jgi:hypothetical protein
VSDLRDLWHGLFDSSVSLQQQANTSARTIENNKEIFHTLIERTSGIYRQALEADHKEIQLLGERFLSRESNTAGKFEWVDGTLTRCILEGSWVILRDGNLCNPSVLDRLNPLFEPGGFISLNECGSLDDKARLVMPHPEFRMFITYDPANGEISRAMRNRGIEINFSIDECTGLTPRRLGMSSSISEVLAIMTANSIPGPVAQNLAEIWVSDSVPPETKSIHHLAKWSQMIDGLVALGYQIGLAVRISFGQCFNANVSMDLCSRMDALTGQLVADMSAFMYPSLENVAHLSFVDQFMSDLGFIVELGKGSNSVEQGTDNWLSRVEKDGALPALAMIGFHQGVGGVCDDNEDVMNAAMSICHRKIGVLFLKIFGSLELRRHQELDAWKLFLSGPKSRMLVASHAVRVALEGYRLSLLRDSLPERLMGCGNSMEAAAWCSSHPFSQEHHQIRDPHLLKWMWSALEALYGAIDTIRDPEVCNSLSLVRRIMMEPGTALDRERVAHSWERLVVSVRDSLEGGSTLPGTVSILLEKVSTLLRGDSIGSQPECTSRFIEMIGRPLVALSFELHEVVRDSYGLAEQIKINHESLAAFRDNSDPNSATLIGMDKDLRTKLLEALRIILVGSMLHADSLAQVHEMLDQVNKLVTAGGGLTQSGSERMTRNASLLHRPGGFEQVESCRSSLSDAWLYNLPWKTSGIASSRWRRGMLRKKQRIWLPTWPSGLCQTGFPFRHWWTTMISSDRRLNVVTTTKKAIKECHEVS